MNEWAIPASWESDGSPNEPFGGRHAGDEAKHDVVSVNFRRITITVDSAASLRPPRR